MTTFDRIKRKYLISRIVSLFLTLALILFICIFLQERNATKRNYVQAYNTSLGNSHELAKTCIDETFDYDTYYRELVGELNICAKMAGFAGLSNEKQATMNSLYAASVKLPRQIKLYLPDITEALNKIIVLFDETAYQDLQVTVDKFDTLDYGFNTFE